MIVFPELTFDQLRRITSTIDNDAYRIAQNIVDEVGTHGESALREYGAKYDGIDIDEPLLIDKSEIDEAAERLGTESRDLLERVFKRIRSFAVAQRNSVHDLEIKIPGGTAGHRWIPLRSAGCYAPGGRYPLPSSVLMTVTTARVAGVSRVWVASPNPCETTLAAASIAGADGVLKLGGAQAIAAMSLGFGELPKCDVIVGPGNRFVTAAKSIVSKNTRIDSLAGPSELVVVSGNDADSKLVAADLLAQAEHDTDARPILIAFDNEGVDCVKRKLEEQLKTLSTATIAKKALQSGGFVVANSIEEAIQYCDELAPEHLSLQGQTVAKMFDKFKAGAALFVGSAAPEVFGDYGAGPNHVLPTGGAARSHSALSVLDFMRFQTVLHIVDYPSALELAKDAAMLARIEGLDGHVRSSELRYDPYEFGGQGS